MLPDTLQLSGHYTLAVSLRTILGMILFTKCAKQVYERLIHTRSCLKCYPAPSTLPRVSNFSIMGRWEHFQNMIQTSLSSDCTFSFFPGLFTIWPQLSSYLASPHFRPLFWTNHSTHTPCQLLQFSLPLYMLFPLSFLLFVRWKFIFKMQLTELGGRVTEHLPSTQW